MTIPVRDQKMLWGAAAGRCSFPRCGKPLVAESSPLDRAVLLGEMAHIVAETLDGPRGQSPLPLEQRNRYDNLILLCTEHHTIIDGQPATYMVEGLHRFKAEHEARCQQSFESAAAEHNSVPLANLQRDRVHGTFLHVLQLPRTVYTATSSQSNEREIKEEGRKAVGRRPPPFVLREGKLWSFHDLSDRQGPFAAWVDPDSAYALRAEVLWDHVDQFRYYVALLNSRVGKFLASRGLQLDLDHGRWFFPAGNEGADREIPYRPLKQKRSTRKVAWRSTIKATGEKRSFWEHLSIRVRFVRVTDRAWILSLRPERHFTRDGETPLFPKTKGRRATKRAARLYNADLLGDTNLWRGFLAENEPRIVMPTGSQSVIIDSRLASAIIEWPGVPEDAIAFTNVAFEEDLFTSAELERLLDAPDEDDVELEDTLGP